MKKILVYLGFYKAKHLKSVSANITNVFTRTLSDLNFVNEKALSAQSDINNKIAKLQDEHTAHQEVIDSNSKIITKLNSFWNS